MVNKKKIMDVILIQDVDNLGATNEVVKVKNGYARNFLFPRQLAIESSYVKKNGNLRCKKLMRRMQLNWPFL